MNTALATIEENPHVALNNARNLPGDYRAEKLSAAIERFITARDDLWTLLAYSAEIAKGDLHRLAVANRHCLRMLELTNGPTTSVLEPARALSESQRCQVCTTFIEQALLES